MKKLFNLILFLIFAVLALTLYLKNPEPFTVNYYFGFEFSSSIALILIVTFAVGVLVGALVASVSVFKSKRQVSKVRKQLSKAEKEVEMMRTVPSTADSSS
jgi:putative membrane protein